MNAIAKTYALAFLKAAAAKKQPAGPSPMELGRMSGTLAGIYKKSPPLTQIAMRQQLVQSLFSQLGGSPQGIRMALNAIGRVKLGARASFFRLLEIAGKKGLSAVKPRKAQVLKGMIWGPQKPVPPTAPQPPMAAEDPLIESFLKAWRG